jgi:UDP-N-acetylmuramyl pentapeptide phosphotransferase/UDP-N-acetylglucosamine-1-phosphate transferase
VAVLALVGTRSPLLAAVLVLATMWMTNLYNFMDGADGLAGGMAVFGFGAYALAAAGGGSTALALGAASVAAAAAAFLAFNYPPARIFMGDVGSVPLGFLAAALGIAGWQRGVWPSWFPVLVFSPFIVDATVTLAQRAARGERVWQAHRSHYYQRLVQLGWGHARTARAEYALMAACALGALAALHAPATVQAALLAAAALGYAALAAAVDRAWARRREGAA